MFRSSAGPAFADGGSALKLTICSMRRCLPTGWPGVVLTIKKELAYFPQDFVLLPIPHHAYLFLSDKGDLFEDAPPLLTSTE